MASLYEKAWSDARARKDVPAGHLPVHRWHLRLDKPANVEEREAPRDGISVMQAQTPSVFFYRFLYHNVGENYLWGDLRRMGDEDLAKRLARPDLHLNVVYDHGTPAGFFEIDFEPEETVNLAYFGLLPGFTGSGLGGWMLTTAIRYAAERTDKPMLVETCTLDHPSALENYKRRGFNIVSQDDFTEFDPRLDGTIPREAASHVPIARPSGN